MRRTLLGQFTDTCLSAAPSLEEWSSRVCRAALPVFERSGARGVLLNLTATDRERVYPGGTQLISIGVDACDWFNEFGVSGFYGVFGEALTPAFGPFRITRMSDLLCRSSMRGFPGWDQFRHTRPHVDAIGVDLSFAGFGVLGSLVPHDGVRERQADLRLMRRVILRTLPARISSIGPDDADAVIAPDGRVLHARGLGRNSASILSSAVRVLERERLESRTAGEGERLWDELLAGRWSVVERLDRDGKRYLLLSRTCDSDASLGPAEKALLERVARGQTLKQVAIELDLPESTASERISAALGKLGFRSRADYLRYARRSKD